MPLGTTTIPIRCVDDGSVLGLTFVPNPALPA